MLVPCIEMEIEIYAKFSAFYTMKSTMQDLFSKKFSHYHFKLNSSRASLFVTYWENFKVLAYFDKCCA